MNDVIVESLWRVYDMCAPEAKVNARRNLEVAIAARAREEGREEVRQQVRRAAGTR